MISLRQLSALFALCFNQISQAEVMYSSKPYKVKNSRGYHYYKPIQTYSLSGKFSNGKASYYGGKFNGRKTSSCVIFDERQLTVAHPVARLPSVAKITRKDGKKSIYVIITDRGPFANNRICDLSVAAAEQLGSKKEGLVDVKIRILPKQSKIIAQHWHKFLHKKLPYKLFQFLGNPVQLENYLRRCR